MNDGEAMLRDAPETEPQELSSLRLSYHAQEPRCCTPPAMSRKFGPISSHCMSITYHSLPPAWPPYVRIPGIARTPAELVSFSWGLLDQCEHSRLECNAMFAARGSRRKHGVMQASWRPIYLLQRGDAAGNSPRTTQGPLFVVTFVVAW